MTCVKEATSVGVLFSRLSELLSVISDGGGSFGTNKSVILCRVYNILLSSVLVVNIYFVKVYIFELQTSDWGFFGTGGITTLFLR